MSPVLVGAWEMVSDTDEGMAVFTEAHYSMVWQNTNRKPYPVDSPTDADELEAYRSHQSQAGTYQVSGSKLTLGREIRRHPGRAGTPAEGEFSIQGDTITVYGFGSPEGLTWRKVT